jgi:hypothetical protein
MIRQRKLHFSTARGTNSGGFYTGLSALKHLYLKPEVFYNCSSYIESLSVRLSAHSLNGNWVLWVSICGCPLRSTVILTAVVFRLSLTIRFRYRLSLSDNFDLRPDLCFAKAVFPSLSKAVITSVTVPLGKSCSICYTGINNFASLKVREVCHL